MSHRHHSSGGISRAVASGFSRSWSSLRRSGPARRTGGFGRRKDWRIDNVDVVLAVQENGDVIVDETYTYTFEGNFHFVARDIPTTNFGGMADIEVRDANGAPVPEGKVPARSDVQNGDLQSIEIYFDLTDTSATWTYHYKAKQAICSLMSETSCGGMCSTLPRPCPSAR